MMPPRKDPSRRPGSGSKGPAGPTASTPGKGSGSAGKASSKPAPAAKSGTPPPTPAGKPASKPNRSSGSSGQLRRAPATAARSGGGNSAKTKMIAMGAVAGLLAIIGILYAVSANKKDNTKIKAELKQKLADIAALPDDQILEKDKRLEELLKNPDYMSSNICGQEAANLKKMYEEEVHPKAGVQREADEKAKPFVDEYGQKKAAGLTVPTAQALMDRVVPLAGDYVNTSWGEPLQKIRNELNDWLQANSSTTKWTDTIKGMQITVDRLLEDGKFKTAKLKITEYVNQWPKDKDDAVFKSEVGKPQDKLNRKIVPYVKELLDKAKEDHDRGNDAEAKTMLQNALAELEGFPQAKEVEAALKNLPK